MKKILTFLLLAIPFFYSCKSVPKDLRSYSPVAIITVYSNPSVPWYDERTGKESVDDGILSGAVNRLINKENPEVTTVQKRIDEASAILSEKMADFSLEVIDPKTMKDSPAYKKAGKTFLDYLKKSVPAEGYSAFTSSNGKMNRLMCSETGAKSAIYVNFRFQKVVVKDGVRDKGVAARLVMNVFGTDSNGKKIINKEYKAVSEEYAEFVRTSEWDKEEVLSFFPALENRVVMQFLMDYAIGDEIPSENLIITPTAIKIKPKAEEARRIKNEDAASGTANETMNEQTNEQTAEEAIKAEKLSTAKKLLERGMSEEEVSEITGLSIEEIRNSK
ncbi:MAG: hypothetical protein IKP49_04165 [Treponema sp.]|nr:hypothetical protein [Treponema sp.]